MTKQPVTSKSYFTALLLIHAALLFGQILPILVFYFLNKEKPAVTGIAATGQMWVYIVGAITIGSILVSSQIFGTQLQKVRGMTNLQEKLAAYRSALIVRYALLEVPSLIAAVGYFLTNNLLLLLFASMTLILFLMYRPSKERAVSDLELDMEETALLNNPDAVVTEWWVRE